ncbi:MAG: M28 family peptidase [Gemmatimonadales bacterium]|nr:M28 family peptidase [Gemmatimonadales bacterium]
MCRVLALPREAGTAEAEAARDIVAAHLAALGYRVTPQRFRFHPGGLLAFPIFGAGLGGLALLLVPLLAFGGPPGWGAGLVLVAGLGALALLSLGIGLGWLPLGGETREDANLLAVRSERPVRRWLVAHLDTKAQRQSMAGRLVAVWVVALAIAVLLALAAARVGGPVPFVAAVPGALLAALAGALAGRGRIRGRTRGARDNGSGIAAALAAAEKLEDPSVGVLVTGAEEFGLVGARVFARMEGSRLAGVEIVNFDTIDGEGEIYLVSHDRRGARLAAGEARRLAGLGPAVRVRRLPLGILVDSLPLSRAGAAAITVGRLTWRTLRRIHTPGDVPEDLSLELAERIGRAIAAN